MHLVTRGAESVAERTRVLVEFFFLDASLTNEQQFYLHQYNFTLIIGLFVCMQSRGDTHPVGDDLHRAGLHVPRLHPAFLRPLNKPLLTAATSISASVPSLSSLRVHTRQLVPGSTVRKSMQLHSSIFISLCV